MTMGEYFMVNFVLNLMDYARENPDFVPCSYFFEQFLIFVCFPM